MSEKVYIFQTKERRKDKPLAPHHLVPSTNYLVNALLDFLYAENIHVQYLQKMEPYSI